MSEVVPSETTEQPEAQDKQHSKLALAAANAVRALAITVLAWAVLAAVIGCFDGHIREGDVGPATSQEPMAVTEVVERLWGIGQQPCPLVLQYPLDDTKPLVRLVRTYRDEQTRAWAEFEVVSAHYKSPQKVTVPYHTVTWQVGSASASPAVTFVFKGEILIEKRPKSFDLWRFATFRGPVWEFYQVDNYDEQLWRLIEEYGRVHLAIPNDPEWTKFQLSPN